MMFEINLGINKIREGSKIRKRTAIRGVIISDNKILMVKNNKGDYKFPGGGMEEGESRQDTLIREVLEETGYKVNKIGSVLGKAVYIDKDSEHEDSYFVMDSIYIECSIDINSKSELNLDNYEKEMEFTPMFIDLDEVIRRQRQVFEENKNDMNFWVERELRVLEILKEKM